MSYQAMLLEDILTAFTPMIKSQIRSLRIFKNEDEFFQIGLIGLWEAYLRYNPEKGPFPPFAQATVKGKLLNHLRKEHLLAERQAVLSEEMLDVVADPNSTILLEREEVLSYCHGLTKKQLKWVMQGILEHKKPMEIAEAEGVSVEQVKGWRKEALKKIKRNYQFNKKY